jgi:hypothetical protein
VPWFLSLFISSHEVSRRSGERERLPFLGV